MRRIVFAFVLLLASAAASSADRWEPVALGVDYLHTIDGAMDIHVARVDLTCDNIRIISARESDRGTRVSDFAKRTRALVAINGDYFDKAMKPIGLTIGPCGQWLETADTTREGVVAFGTSRGEIRTQSEVMDPPEPWIMSAVSGWPMLIRECHALTSAELPGSDAFTRSPHARTAVGVSKEGTIAYFVVADGRRADAPGLTLGQLGAWMFEHLGVCSAINLDGGGSSAMWIKDKIVNRPSDGVERRVGDHLAVVPSDQKIGCDMKEQLAASAASSGIGIAQSAKRQ
jgi:exopolysaccharide biosynthesis protein